MPAIAWRSVRGAREMGKKEQEPPSQHQEGVSKMYLACMSVCMRVVCLVSKETLGRRAGLNSGVGGVLG